MSEHGENELKQLKEKAEEFGYVLRKKPVKKPREASNVEKLYVYAEKRRNGAFLFSLMDEKLPQKEHDEMFVTSNKNFIKNLIERGIIEMEEEAPEAEEEVFDEEEELSE